MDRNLLLYVMPGCPYCSKVLRFMEEKGISVPLKGTNEPGARSELIEKGGKFQAPCLFIDGKPLYESDDIIAWLDANLS